MEYRPSWWHPGTGGSGKEFWSLLVPHASFLWSLGPHVMWDRVRSHTQALASTAVDMQPTALSHMEATWAPPALPGHSNNTVCTVLGSNTHFLLHPSHHDQLTLYNTAKPLAVTPTWTRCYWLEHSKPNALSYLPKESKILICGLFTSCLSLLTWTLQESGEQMHPSTCLFIHLPIYPCIHLCAQFYWALNMLDTEE